MARTTKNKSKIKRASANYELEVEFLAGLDKFVKKELKRYGHISQVKKNSLILSYSGDLRRLKDLKTVVAVYLLNDFEIPRPKAILGQENFTRLIANIRLVLEQNQFKSFRINAAGRDSSVYKRIAQEIAKATKLKHKEDGELLLRFRKEKNIWQALIRLSPKTLAARDWRVCNMPGGLNATVAYAINAMANIETSDYYVNAMCGSGTLLIENNRAKKLLGFDNSEKALECAKANLEKSHTTAKLILADASKMPFKDKSVDIIAADLPWGDAVGKHSENASLYTEFLKESARASSRQARLLILTHEIKIFKNLIKKQNTWQIAKELQVYHGGHYPKIYLLQKVRAK